MKYLKILCLAVVVLIPFVGPQLGLSDRALQKQPYNRLRCLRTRLFGRH